MSESIYRLPLCNLPDLVRLPFLRLLFVIGAVSSLQTWKGENKLLFLGSFLPFSLVPPFHTQILFFPPPSSFSLVRCVLVLFLFHILWDRKFSACCLVVNFENIVTVTPVCFFISFLILL